METELKIEVLGQGNVIPPFSARGCVQTLAPIVRGELHRTVNGDLVRVGGENLTKYHSRITCKEKQSLALGGVVVGARVRLSSIQRLVEPVSAEAFHLKYSAVPGSLYFIPDSGNPIPMEGTQLPPGHGAGFVSYRPILEMMITHYTLETDEWGMTVGWKIELEEI